MWTQLDDVRWSHTDGRRAFYVIEPEPGQPNLFVLNADCVILYEFTVENSLNDADPLKGVQFIRAVAATEADDAPTPQTDDEAWELLRGWV